jgi:hypothetical protein
MITPADLARTAERLRDALSAAADVMAEPDAAAVITPVPQRPGRLRRARVADPAGRRGLRSRGHRCLGIAYHEPRPHVLVHVLVRQPAGVPGALGLHAASGGRTGNGPATVLRDD